jgi:hypothetical protein
MRAWLSPRSPSAALHRSLDGTRVVNYAQLRSAEDWETLRKVGQMRAHFDRTTKFGKLDAHSTRWFTLWSIQPQAKLTAVRYMTTRHET